MGAASANLSNNLLCLRAEAATFASAYTYVSVLLDRLLRSKLKDLAAFVTGTDAAAFTSTEGERTSAGIQAELASVMRSFGYLDDTEDGFSIRDWVEKGADGSCLFITVKADQLPSASIWPRRYYRCTALTKPV